MTNRPSSYLPLSCLLLCIITGVFTLAAVYHPDRYPPTYVPSAGNPEEFYDWDSYDNPDAPPKSVVTHEAVDLMCGPLMPEPNTTYIYWTPQGKVVFIYTNEWTEEVYVDDVLVWEAEDE